MTSKGLLLMSPHPSLCQECGGDHSPGEPHDRDSLYYNLKWSYDHPGTWPTWDDAMAHCDTETRLLWSGLLATAMAERN